MVALSQDLGRPVLVQGLHVKQDLREYPEDVQVQLGVR